MSNGTLIGRINADQIKTKKFGLKGLTEEHEAQLINYRKATEKEVGLLLNFGKSSQFKRKVFTNSYKEKNHLRKSVKSALSAFHRFNKLLFAFGYHYCRYSIAYNIRDRPGFAHEFVDAQ